MTDSELMSFIENSNIEIATYSDRSLKKKFWTVKMPPYTLKACQGPNLRMQLMRLNDGQSDVTGQGD